MDYSKLFDTARDIYANFSYNNKEGKAIIPLRYFFELTYRCNLNCPYCYVGSDRQKNELSTQDWLNIIKQVPRYAFVTLVGGEPLVRHDFCDILYAVSKRVYGKLNVVTNGILINEDVIDAFIKSKMMLLSVSIDGWGKNHDLNRNRDGIFDRITKNLETLNYRRQKHRNKPMVDIKTIVLNNNIDDLLKLYEYTTEMGFEFLSISFLRNNDLKQNSVLKNEFEPVFYEPNYPIQPYFDMEHFEDVYRKISKMAKNSKTKIRFSPKFEGGGVDEEMRKIKAFFTPKNKTDLNRHPKDIYYPCKYPFSNMMINPQGDVYPCLSFKIGNVKDAKIKDVFNETKFKCFRKNLKYSKSFTSCQMCCELKVK